MLSTILMQKIIALVYKFNDNPTPLLEYYSYYKTSDPKIIRAANHYVVLGVGKFFVEDTNMHYTNMDNQLVLKCGNAGQFVIEECHNVSNSKKFDLSNLDRYTPEYMFQEGLFLNEIEYAALESFIYLKRTGCIPFMINLGLIDLDEALDVYVKS